jgi:hypothetical protein
MTETDNQPAGSLSACVDLPAIEPGIVDTLKTMIEHAQLELLTIAERTEIGDHLTPARSHLVSALLAVDTHVSEFEQLLCDAAHAVEWRLKEPLSKDDAAALGALII